MFGEPRQTNKARAERESDLSCSSDVELNAGELMLCKALVKKP